MKNKNKHKTGGCSSVNGLCRKFKENQIFFGWKEGGGAVGLLQIRFGSLVSQCPRFNLENGYK